MVTRRAQEPHIKIAFMRFYIGDRAPYASQAPILGGEKFQIVSTPPLRQVFTVGRRVRSELDG